MKLKNIAACGVLAAVVLTANGCKSPAKQAGDNFGKKDPTVTIVVNPRAANDPTGTSGTLGIPVTSATSGNGQQNCFPFAQGWNRFYVTFYFLGPDVNPLPTPNSYPNPDNLNSFTIDTRDAANGTTLNTGIVVINDANPTQKWCNDDAVPPFSSNPKLSRLTVTPTTPGARYRVTVFYKNSTAAGLTNLVVRWSYP